MARHTTVLTKLLIVLSQKQLSLHCSEQLERVFLRLGLAETDDQLQATVSKFLSPVLLKLSSTQEGVRKKVMELLVHLNKRLKSRPKIQLPVESLLLQYQDPSAVSFVTNFTIIYIKMGYPRLPMDKQVDLLPSLLQCLEDKPQPHQDSLLQLMMPVLNHLTMPEDPERRKAMFRLSEKPKTAQIMLEFMLDMLLLPYVVLPPGGAQGAEGAEGGRPQSAPANTSGGTPPGMSQASVKRVTGDKQWKPEELEEVKVGIVKFLGADIFAEEEVIPHLLVGMSDTRHSVASAADYEFRRKQSGIDWNNTALITRLYKLFLGYTAEKPTKKGAPTIRPELRREPAGTRVRLKVFPYFLRSREAAEHFPGNLQIIFECLYGVHTNAKLRQMTLQFIHYICSCASDAKIQPLGQLVLNALQKLIGEGKEDAKLRSLAYVAIGKLANRLPHLFSKDIGMVQKFFDAVSKEDQDTRLAIQEALSLMATAYKNLDDTSARLMEALILSNVEKPDAPARLAAVHYANTVFPSNHVPSRYVLLLACGDSKEEIHSEAVKALRASPQSSGHGSQDEPTPKTLPSFKEMVTYINEKATQRMKTQAKYSVGANAIPFNPGTFTETVLYMRRCLATDAGVAVPADDNTPSPEGSPAVASYVHTLLEESGNSNKGPVHLYMNLIKQLLTAVGGAGPLYCLLEIVAVCPNKLAKQFTGKLDWIKGLMHHSRDDIREHASQLYGLVACTLGAGKFNNAIKELTRNLQDQQSPEVQHGSVLGLGYAIGRHLYIRRTQVTVEDLEEEKDHGIGSSNISDMEVAAVKAVVEMLDNPSSLLATAACTALGEIARNGPLPLPTGGVGKGKGKNPNPCTKLAIVEKLVARVKSSKDSNKLKERLCQTLGYLPVGDPDFQHQRAVLQGLLEAAEVRAPELHFTVGEALACAALGPRSGAGRDMWTEADSEYQTEAGGGRGKDEMAWMVGLVLEKYSQDQKPWIRQSAGIWLLSLVKKAGEHPVLQGRLKEIQNVFLNLLSEPDDLTQDVGSKGLGLVYERGGSAHRDELVALLVDTLMSGRRSAQHVTGETAVFQAGELGRTPGGENMSTYKELCSLASDLNQPDLIYKFMNLANHNAMWNSKKGAAFGFSTIALQAGEQLTPHLPKIVPRLYRYQFDPNPNIRQSMTSIWAALVPEARKTIDKYLKEILEDLQTNLTNSQWRVRESSCMALNDLLRGRQLEEAIIESLPALWETCLKVRDDIKESVRNAAEKACQGLMRTSIKVCDPSAGKLGEKAVELVLPCLMKAGLGSSVKEVRAISLMTILKISQNAGKLLKPHIAVLVPALLEALSGLEPQALNYLSFHVGGGASQAEKLDSARIAASKASPMMEVANLCVQYVDGGVLPDLVPRLTELIRSGVGVATKAGCSSFIISLTMQCSHELQPHAGKLLSALLSGLNDRNSAVRKNYAAAIGHLVKSAKDSSVEKLIAKLKTWYLEKEESSIRQACGLTLQAMARHNPDVLKRHATQVLPLAFLAMHEKRDKEAGGESEQGQSVWEEVWLDSIPGTESGIKLYLKEIIELVRPALEAQSWHTKAQAASAMNTVATKLGANLGPPHLGTMLRALVGGLAGRTWKGKEELLKAITSVCVQCKTSLANPQEGTTSQPSVEEVVEAVLKESRKEKLEYKKEAIRCLTATLETYSLDRFKQLSEILFPLLRKSTDGNGNKEEEEEIEKHSPGVMEDFVITSYEGLGKAWPQEKQTQVEFQDQFGALLCTALTSSTWKVQCAVLKATGCYIDRLWMLQDGVTLTNEDTTTLTKFVEQLVPPLCQCLENTKYTAIRLEASSVASKLLKTLSGPDKDSILPADSQSCLQKSAEKLGKDSVPELQDRAAEIKKLLQPSS